MASSRDRGQMAYATDLEIHMLGLINQERTSRGLNALELEINLNTSADRHSDWMLGANIFSHTGSGNSSANDRIVSAGFDLAGSWGTAENIAIQTSRGATGYFDDVEDLHTSLMNSSGHRANILNPNLEFIGIGIDTGSFTYDSGYSGHSVIVTQNFGRTAGNVELDDLNQGNGAIGAPFVGTSVGDVFVGTVQSETISGNGGNDDLSGNNGEDVIYGGAGRDILSGGADNDDLYGEDGSDKLYGQSGRDRLDGGVGHDKLYGGSGYDQMFGGLGNDLLFAGNGKDKMDGGNGQDKLYGGRGNDIIQGRSGNDIISGGADRDFLVGGKGDDIYWGDSGADRFHFDLGGDQDIIRDFKDDVDTIELDNFSFSSISEVLSYGKQIGDDFVMNFGGGDVLTVSNTTLGELENDLIIVG